MDYMENKMKHDINNLKESIRRAGLFIRVYDAEILSVSLFVFAVISFTCSVMYSEF
jgi:hypothetical protein